MFIAVSLLVPKLSSAGSFELTVYGYVRDSGNNLVENAEVVITNLDTAYTHTMYTDEDGQYFWNIPTDEWFDGDTIHVFVTYASSTGENQGDAVDSSPWGIQLDVTLSNAIPEFGSTLGVLVAISMLGMVAIVVLGTKRRDS